MRRRQRDSDERERSKTPITVRKIVESLKSPESTGNMASQKPTSSKSASASTTSANTNHDRTRSVILQPKSNPVMSFAYGAPVLPGVNDGHSQHGQSPRRSRGRAGSSAGGAASGDGHSEASTSKRTASNYPGAWNGDTSSPKYSRNTHQQEGDDDDSNVIRQEPAVVRYARLKQRLKDTGSSRPPTNNEEEEDDSESEAVNGSEQPEESASVHQQQRGNGTGVIQHNEPPKESSYKDTSVNIATAFWQAAGGPVRTAMPAPRPAQAATTDDSNNHTHDNEEDDTNRGIDDVSATQSPEQPTVPRKEYPNPITSGKKRKKPTGGYKGTTSEKDRPFKISKKDLNEGSSDDSEEYEEEGEIDLDELKFEMGYGPARKAGGSSATGIVQAVKKPKAKQAKKTAGEEASTAPTKTTTVRRKSTHNKDGAYKPGQDDDEQEDEDDFNESTSTRRKSLKGKGKARETSVAASEQSRGVSEAPSAGGQSMTSYYLQEPQVSTVSAADKSTRLTQIHPKTNTYQPYFAFSTTTTSLSKAAQTRPRAPSSSTNQSSVPDSARGGTGTGNGTRAGGTSSNASFNERGSEYDYAEEERMLATLQAAKERAENGRLLPEGRPFSSLVGGNDKSASHHRKVSLDASEDSRENMMQAQASQAQQKQNATGQRKLGPKRGPPPPDRESSILSESASSQLNGYTTPALDDAQSSANGNDRSIGRKLGQLVRKLFVLLYWITVGPYKVIKGQDLNTLLKWAAAVGFTALVLAAMQEQRPSNSSPPSSTRRWHTPFISSPSSSSEFAAPNGLPSNLDELVARLTNLEASFSALSSKQSSDHLHMFENTRSASDTVKRLTMLEADFEAERRKMNKMNEGIKKDSARADEKVEANLKGVKTQLDYLAEKVKTLTGDRKQDALDTAKLKDGVSHINKDISSLSRRLADLQKEVGTGHDSDNIAKLVTKAIEDILPSRMAVSVDPKSGQVQIDPKFWQHLRSAFSPSSPSSDNTESGQPRKAIASWDEFLVANQQSLQRFISEDVDARFSKGALLSTKAFSDVLYKEIEGLRAELSQSSFDSLSKLSSDFSAKLAKATSSSGKAASTIKLSSGEDLNAIVMQLIDSALEKYSKDVLAKPDFALYSAGGRIIPSLTSPTYEIRPNTFTGSLLSTITGRGVIRGRAPVTALHPDISVGQCWPFAGQSGQLGILLSRRIVPEDITIEHASKDVALNVSSAPKRFEVWGLIEDHETMEKLASSLITPEGQEERLVGNRLLLISGEYDVNASSHLQTFPVDQTVRDLQVPVNVVIVRILENHGNEALSCLYRVRVGGTVVEEEM